MPAPRALIFWIGTGGLLAALPVCVPTAAAPDSPNSSPAASAAKAPPKVVTFSADSSMYLPDGRRILNGHVHFIESDTHLYADRIVYNENTKKGEAIEVPDMKGGSVGRPHANDDLHTLTADKLTFDLSSKDPTKKVVSAVGNVKFVAEPKPGASTAADPKDQKPKDAAPAEADASGDQSSKKDRFQRRVKEETIMTCDRLDYYYRTRRAVAENNLKVVQGKRWLTGDQAIYYDRYDTVVVNGHVKGEDEKGRTFAADNLKVILTGDTETIEANRFEGSFTLDEEEEESGPTGTPGAADEKPPVFEGSEGPNPASPPPTDKQ
jgi:lipopolysaccharide assembly outer membrane protein LptD (OstA)